MFSNTFDIFEFIFESSAASFIAVKGNSEAVHLIADPSDEPQTFTVIGKFYRLHIARKKQFLFIFCQSDHRKSRFNSQLLQRFQGGVQLPLSTIDDDQLGKRGIFG